VNVGNVRDAASVVDFQLLFQLRFLALDVLLLSTGCVQHGVYAGKSFLII
jgi:hypothetical protein